MKETKGILKCKNKEYEYYFNINVMETIQEKYGTLEKWAELTDGKGKEPDLSALIFGFTEMLNEAIDIQNEESEEKKEFLTRKQVGRIITEVGLSSATNELTKTVIESTKSDEKNA